MTANLDNPGTIVPHKGKMLLLSRIIGYNLEEQTLCAEYDITENCIFYNPAIGGVPAWVGFEFLGQAISALSGLRGHMSGDEPKIGYILSVSSMQIDIHFFKAGNTVQINVKESGRMDQVYNFEGTIFLEGKKVLDGKLTVIETTGEQSQSILEGAP
jgi:predicted hotdog family 3-hydroxylacyl-ACP dehydratase